MYQPIEKVDKHKSRRTILLLLASAAVAATVTWLMMKYGQPSVPFTETENSTFDEKNEYTLDFGNVNGPDDLCSKMGRWILKKNGSAVDSAITTMICNGITDPSMIGFGGGFVMTIYDRKNKQAHCLNAKDAPLAAHKNVFEGADSTSSKIEPLAIRVPGEVAGYWEAHQKYGKLAWSDLFKPNIQLCKTKLRTYLQTRPELCNTMKMIADEGANTLYNGKLGEMLIEDLNELGSAMTIEDLKNYRVKWSDPVVTDFLNGKKLFTSPGSGGILSLILNIFDEFKFSHIDLVGLKRATKTYHRMIETWKYAYAIGSQMQDPGFTDMTDLMKNFTSKDFARIIKDKIDDSKTWNETSHYGGADILLNDEGTSHISVVAPNGDAVAVTSSLNGNYYNQEKSDQTGILLNNAESIDSVINSSPEVNENNKVESKKQSLSSMVPSIITTSNGDVRMVIGAAGGKQIITSVSYIIARHLFMGNSIQQAISVPRIFYKLNPMTVTYNHVIVSKILYGLQELGHVLKPALLDSSVIALVTSDNGTIIDHYGS